MNVIFESTHQPVLKLLMENKVFNCLDLPMLVSYACRYSLVINWDTKDDLPTAGPPNISTRNGVGPGAEVELSLEEAKLQEAEVRADPAAEVGPGSCSVLQQKPLFSIKLAKLPTGEEFF